MLPLLPSSVASLHTVVADFSTGTSFRVRGSQSPSPHCRREVKVVNGGGGSCRPPFPPWSLMFLAFSTCKMLLSGSLPVRGTRNPFLTSPECEWDFGDGVVKRHGLAVPWLLPGMGRPSVQLVTLQRCLAMWRELDVGPWRQSCTWPASRALSGGVARHLFMTALLVVLGTVRQRIRRM